MLRPEIDYSESSNEASCCFDNNVLDVFDRSTENKAVSESCLGKSLEGLSFFTSSWLLDYSVIGFFL